uniref:CW domain-containing protein n=2 Tax=Caenorhabditis tropicalis TaxID=1561998 RepID=A0A1I7UZF1_9PELO
MMLIRGRVVGESLDGEIVRVGCKETCYNLPNCILAFMDSHNHCILFDFNSTIQLKVEETDEPLFVAFKTWLPSDSCPIYSEMLPVVKIGEDTIPWTKTSNTFNFLKCVGDWKMFQRPSGITVCMQPISLYQNISLTEARDYCEGLGYKMTGLGTVEEAQWAFKKMNEIHPNLKQWEGFWMDGHRNCTPPLKADCQVFSWTDGYTVGNKALAAADISYHNWGDPRIYHNCLQMGRPQYGKVFNDVDCNGTDIFFGVICGYRLY